VSYRFRGRVALALVALGAAVVWAADGEAPSISPRELEARLARGGELLVLDVRTPEEYAAGHVPGAINVPHEQVAARAAERAAGGEVTALAAELVGGGEVAVYCRKGPRARLAEAALQRAGRQGVLHLEGGFTAWEADGLPVAKGAAPE
jgi:rhodanese-related sulfurtransferase